MRRLKLRMSPTVSGKVMKVLLVDTAFAAAPIYDYLLSEGFDVWVMGSRPEDVLARRAGSQWICQDYSQIDMVRGIVRAHGFDCVVPGCTDVSIHTCLHLDICTHRFDSVAANTTLSDKSKFRQLCRQLDLPAPETLNITQFPRPGHYICKPTDAYSGRGITTFDGMDVAAGEHAVQLAQSASPSHCALIEEFIQGNLYSFSAFIENGLIVQGFYVIEGSSANPFAVDTSYLVWDIPRPCRDSLEPALERMCHHLGLVDGLLHTQFIFDGSRPYIVEVSRRCPGDLYPLLIEYSTGFPYAATYAYAYAQAQSRPQYSAQSRYVLRHTVAALTDTIYGGLKFTDNLSVKAFYPLLPLGKDLMARQGNRAGVLFCESASYEDISRTYEKFLDRSVYKIE